MLPLASESEGARTDAMRQGHDQVEAGHPRSVVFPSSRAQAH